MPDITVNIPTVGSEFFATFKEPINTFLKNKVNLDPLTIKLKVVSVISMKDMIRNDLRDPYTELYSASGISEVEYKKDIIDNVPIISFSFIDLHGAEKFIRAPANYINSVSSVSDIEYINKLLVLDLNRLPVSLDTTIFFAELSSFIEARLGILPAIKEVGAGNIELVTALEHSTRETVRTNMITVHKTMAIQLAEANLRYDQILNRLQVMGVSLG